MQHRERERERDGKKRLSMGCVYCHSLGRGEEGSVNCKCKLAVGSHGQIGQTAIQQNKKKHKQEKSKI